MPGALSAGECDPDSVPGAIGLASFDQQPGRCDLDLRLCRTDAAGRQISRSSRRAGRAALPALPGRHGKPRPLSGRIVLDQTFREITVQAATNLHTIGVRAWTLAERWPQSQLSCLAPSP